MEEKIRPYVPFYENWLDGLYCIDDVLERWKLLEAILKYAFNAEEVELDGTMKAAFEFIKPSIDKSRAAYENGCKPKKKKKEIQDVAENSQVSLVIDSEDNSKTNIPDFNYVYGIYPRKSDKEATERNYNLLLKADYDQWDVLMCLETYLSEIKKNKTADKYILKSENFFNEEKIRSYKPTAYKKARRIERGLKNDTLC